MCPGGHSGMPAVASLLLLLTEVSGSTDCQTLLHGTKGHPTYNVSIYEDESENFTLKYDAGYQIMFFRCDPQTGKKEEIAIGHPMNLKNLVNETGVSLINQIVMVKNAKKRHEGLYIISSHNFGTCLAQMYLTVLDLPPPPPLDVTATSYVNTSLRSPVSPFRSNGRHIALGLAVGLFIIILVAVAIFFLQPNWIKCLKRESSTYECAASSPSGSTVESGIVVNGFGQHQPQEYHLDFLNQTVKQTGESIGIAF